MSTLPSEFWAEIVLPSILILSISALPFVSRMPGIVTVSLLALPSVVLPLTVRLPIISAFSSTSNVSI